VLIGNVAFANVEAILPTNLAPSTNISPRLPENPWKYGSFDESLGSEFQDAVSDTITIATNDTLLVPIDSILNQDLSDSLIQSDTLQLNVIVSDSTSYQNVKTDSSSLADIVREESSRIPPLSEVISYTKIIVTIFVLLLTWVLTRFVTSVLTNMSERFQNYRLMIKRVIPVLKVIAWSLGLYFVIAGVLQPPLETIITVSASIGIAVGFASQDILRNIFGGIMIILDRPFQVGDKIQVDSNYGEVTEIGLRSVRIVTEDDSMVTIPNGEIMNKAVSNSNSSALDCQVVAELFLPSKIDINAVDEVCRKAAMTSRYAYLNKPVFVHTTHGTMGPRDFLKVRIKAYVLDIRFEQELRSDMTNLAITELTRRGLINSNT
ncbi:MAG TPA: hypothetical protein DCE78_04665, partial [Bacteroidetes bacterium]|nr:hypothetical protein [Bacteroidota bacterium]